MPVKIIPRCPVCGEEKIYFEEDTMERCNICGASFEDDSSCSNGHHVCPMCRQKAARQAILAHCRGSLLDQPYPLMLELMKLPEVMMHGPEHHLLLPAAFITAYANEKGMPEELPELLERANERSIQVPGGACGAWGICGAAVGAGIFMSIVTGSSPFAKEEWRISGQLTARCADKVSSQGGPRCCKRDGFLALAEAAAYSNSVLDTHFEAPGDIKCEFYPNNEQCKGKACPFFPKKA